MRGGLAAILFTMLDMRISPFTHHRTAMTPAALRFEGLEGRGREAAQQLAGPRLDSLRTYLVRVAHACSDFARIAGRLGLAGAGYR